VFSESCLKANKEIYQLILKGLITTYREGRLMRMLVMFFSILVILVCSTMVYGAPDDTMVLCLSFDNDQGGIVKDSSMYALDGRSQGVNWVDGKFGKAAEFNGVDSFVEVADSKQLLLLNGGTFMAWANIYTESGHATWPRILIKSNVNGGTNGYDFLFDRALGYSLRLCMGGVCNTYDTPVEAKSWHNVAVTFDGKMIYAYIDGQKIGEGPQAGPAIDTTGSVLRIGNGIIGDPRPYNGLLDEIRIWSRALKEDEINWQMTRGTLDIIAVNPALKLAGTWGMIKTSEILDMVHN
jgi:hypothetical protein